MESADEIIAFVDTWIHGQPTEELLEKRLVLELLKKHKVNVAIVESPTILVEEVIPALRKAKVKMPEAFFKDLASKLKVTYLGLSSIKRIHTRDCIRDLACVFPYYLVEKYKIAPLGMDATTVKIALSNPLDPKITMAMRCLFNGSNIELAVSSPTTIEHAIENMYREVHKEASMLDLYNRLPDQSARTVLIPRQKYLLVTVIAALVIGSIFNSTLTFAVFFASAGVFYFLINPVKIYISLRGFQGVREPITITEGEMKWVSDEDLPVYTILVPIYHEAKILPQLLQNLYNINYPKEKLDIKILMEENDEETINEAKQIGLFGSPTKLIEEIPQNEYTDFLAMFNPVIVPLANIQTKPRALNFGLLRARGENCVVYDAEDSPDPDQLKKAAIIFLRSENSLGCLQSKLNFYNASENTLTTWFSIEYSYWYEYYLPGLDWINAPIPLGGTSNHFRVDLLNELGRWDPYNVTEDADLGVRLARGKSKTEIINTYTYEESPINAKSWIRQRSRWYKGHVQTYLVHMRHPRKLMKDLGTMQFLKFQLTFGGNIFMPLLNPVLWIVTALSLITQLGFYNLIPSYLQYIGLFNLAVGNLTYIMMYVIACVKRKKPTAIPFALLMPLYWVLVSISSYRGLIQLIRKPFYWDKTSHGKSNMTKPAISVDKISERHSAFISYRHEFVFVRGHIQDRYRNIKTGRFVKTPNPQ